MKKNSGRLVLALAALSFLVAGCAASDMSSTPDVGSTDTPSAVVPSDTPTTTTVEDQAVSDCHQAVSIYSHLSPQALTFTEDSTSSDYTTPPADGPTWDVTGYVNMIEIDCTGVDPSQGASDVTFSVKVGGAEISPLFR